MIFPFFSTALWLNKKWQEGFVLAELDEVPIFPLDIFI